MRYTDGTQLTNDDLIAIYPRRLIHTRNVEVWQMPYVKNDVLFDEDDLVGVYIGDLKNSVVICSLFKERLQDEDHLNRTTLFVHDLHKDFDIDTCYVHDSSELTTAFVINEILKKGEGNV